MVSSRYRTWLVRAFLYPPLLTAGWLAGVPVAGAQPAAATTAIELVSRRDGVHDGSPGWKFDSLRHDLGSDGRTLTPAASASHGSPRTKRDSIKNGLLIGAAVGSVLSVFGTKMADCPPPSERCPGTKALGIAITVATGAAMGAGIDFLVDVKSPGLAPARSMQRDILVAGRLRW